MRYRGSLAWMVAAVAAFLILGTASAQDREKPTGPKPVKVTGEIISCTDGVLTVAMRGDSGTRQETFRIGEKTGIIVETGETEMVAGEGGVTKPRPKRVAGTTADLVAGKRVVLSAVEGVGREMVVLRSPVPKEGGERKGPVDNPTARPKGDREK